MKIISGVFAALALSLFINSEARAEDQLDRIERKVDRIMRLVEDNSGNGSTRVFRSEVNVEAFTNSCEAYKQRYILDMAVMEKFAFQSRSTFSTDRCEEMMKSPNIYCEGRAKAYYAERYIVDAAALKQIADMCRTTEYLCRF